MERQQVLDEVASSDPRDWEFTEMSHEPHRVFVYSQDVDLRIEDRHMNGIEDEGWEAEWSEGLTGNTVRKGPYYVYYRSTPVRKFSAAQVDNKRALIPLMSSSSKPMRGIQYRLAEILSGDPDDVEEAVRRSGLKPPATL